MFSPESLANRQLYHPLNMPVHIFLTPLCSNENMLEYILGTKSRARPSRFEGRLQKELEKHSRNNTGTFLNELYKQDLWTHDLAETLALQIEFVLSYLSGITVMANGEIGSK